MFLALEDIMKEEVTYLPEKPYATSAIRYGST